jgi:sulfur-carrier protein
MSKVTVRYWAAAKAAARVPEESVEAATLAEALDAVVSGRTPDDPLRTVLARSSFLVNATPVGRAAKESVLLDDGAVVEVLPPFAGGCPTLVGAPVPAPVPAIGPTLPKERDVVHAPGISMRSRVATASIRSPVSDREQRARSARAGKFSW